MHTSIKRFFYKGHFTKFMVEYSPNPYPTLYPNKFKTTLHRPRLKTLNYTFPIHVTLVSFYGQENAQNLKKFSNHSSKTSLTTTSNIKKMKS